MSIHRFSNPLLAQTLAKPLRRAFGLMRFEGDPGPATDYLIAHCDNPSVGLWMGLESAKIVGVICCILPTTPLSTSPEITVLANWGQKPVADDLIAAAIAFAKDAGYNTMIVCNRNERGDKIFERRHRSPGRTLKRIGTYWQFQE